MSGAIPLLPLYAFIVWARTNLPSSFFFAHKLTLWGKKKNFLSAEIHWYIKKPLDFRGVTGTFYIRSLKARQKAD